MLRIKREFDLHVEVVKFNREKYPEAVLLPGLGEFRDSGDARIKAWQKGYTSGQPDLIILYPSECTGYIGFAIEFKHPRGQTCTTENQDKYFKRLQAVAVKTMVFHKFSDIIIALTRYLGLNLQKLVSHEVNLPSLFFSL